MNNFVDLVKMMNREVHIVGTVAPGGVDNIRNLVTLTLLSGETITVKKSIEVLAGDQCLVRGDIIISVVPDLAIYNVTIY